MNTSVGFVDVSSFELVVVNCTYLVVEEVVGWKGVADVGGIVFTDVADVGGIVFTDVADVVGWPPSAVVIVSISSISVDISKSDMFILL